MGLLNLNISFISLIFFLLCWFTSIRGLTRKYLVGVRSGVSISGTDWSRIWPAELINQIKSCFPSLEYLLSLSRFASALHSWTFMFPILTLHNFFGIFAHIIKMETNFTPNPKKEFREVTKGCGIKYRNKIPSKELEEMLGYRPLEKETEGWSKWWNGVLKGLWLNKRSGKWLCNIKFFRY